MSIVVKQLSYIHTDKELLFRNLNFNLSKGQKIALIGNNGSGKSTLLQIIAGHLQATEGDIIFSEKPYYIPQHFGQYDDLNVAEALRIDHKIKAMEAIIGGDSSVSNFALLDDDWNIEERVRVALDQWNLQDIQLPQLIKNLSGGEKSKVFLSAVFIHNPPVILMDEPSNHLDADSRQQLYEFIETSKATMIVVSHDRKLLNLLNLTYELDSNSVEIYGGNYDFYKTQKIVKLKALEEQQHEKEKALRQAKKIAKETAERKQRQDSRGEKKQLRQGTPRIAMNTLRNKAEQSASKLKDAHVEKMEGIVADLNRIRQKLPDIKELKMTFKNASLHTGKILVTAKNINFGYNSKTLWNFPLDFQIRSGDRVAVSGSNGSGKTTLIKIIIGRLQPTEGILCKAESGYLYLDQDYSLIDDKLTLFEQIQEFNTRHFLEHELKMLLHHFLFTSDMWNKTCDKLSGGEKMKLIFCCLMVSNDMPDMIILDEPANNLDIQSLEIVAASIKEYKGTVIVISHDNYFIEEIGVNKCIRLPE